MPGRPLELKVVGDAGQLQRELRKAAGQLSRFAHQAERSGQAAAKGSGEAERAFERTGHAVDSYGGRLRRVAKLAAGAFAAGALVREGKQAINVTEELGKTTLTLSKSFGLNVTQASRWAAVSQARGADGKQMTMGFKALATAAKRARDGTGDQAAAVDALREKNELALRQAREQGKSAFDLTRIREKQALAEQLLAGKVSGNAKIFAQLGISQKELVAHGDDMDWLLRRVSDGMSKLPVGTDKAAISARLFGRTWTAIAPIIRSGSKEMDEQLRMADKYGVTFKGKTLKSVQDFVLAEREAKLATMGLQLALGTTLIPVVTEVSRVTTIFARDVRKHWPAIKDDVEGVVEPVRSIGEALASFAEANPELAKAAGSFAIIGAGAAKLSKATGAGGLVKLAFARGNTPVAPMYVKDVTGGLGSGGKPKATVAERVKDAAKSPVVWFGAPAAATAFSAAANQSKAFRGGPTVGTGAPDDGGGLTGFLRKRVAKALGIEDPKALNTAGYDKSLKEMADKTALMRRKVDHELGPRLRLATAQADRTWKRLSADTSTSMNEIRATVKLTTQSIRGRMGSDTLAGRVAMARNLDDAVDAIRAQMRRGRLSTAEGLEEIRKLFQQKLALFGFSPKQAARYAAGQDPLTGKDSTSYSPGGKAGGGWIGMRGQAGPDAVPTLLGVGEAVLNRHQQRPVETAMRAVYGFGLDELFARVRTPHHMASGGRIPDQRFPTGLGVLSKLGQTVFDRADAAAEARLATLDPAALPSTGTSSGLAPQVRRALEWARAHGWHGQVTSGRRSTAKQQWLWDNAGRLGLVRGVSVAKPGTSMHEHGLAVDVTDWQGFKRAMQDAPANARLIWRGPSDVVHFSTTGHAGGGWVDDAAPGAVGGVNSRARRSELAWMRRAWELASPSLPGAAGKAMPAMSFSKSSLFVGQSGSYRKGRLFWPDWVWQGRDKLPKAVQLSLLIHEWAHAFQRSGLSETDTEGGATLFARRVAPQVAKALGMPYSQPFNDDQYVGEMKRAKKHGEAWIMRGQFTKPPARAGVSKFARGGRVSYERLQGLWRQAGGPARFQSIAAAVAMAESGGDPRASHRNRDGSVDRGLWQINSVHGALSTFDQLGNARAAVRISKRGADWGPWAVYASGAYRRHLREGLPADAKQLRKKVPMLGAITGQAPKKPTGYVYVHGKKTPVYGPSDTGSVRPGGFPTVPARQQTEGSFLKIPETVAGMGGNAAAVAQGATPGANVEGGSGTGQPADTSAANAQAELARIMEDVARIMEDVARNQRTLIEISRTQPNQLLNAILDAASGGIGARVNTMTPGFAGAGVRH